MAWPGRVDDEVTVIVPCPPPAVAAREWAARAPDSGAPHDDERADDAADDATVHVAMADGAAPLVVEAPDAHARGLRAAWLALALGLAAVVAGLRVSLLRPPAVGEPVPAAGEPAPAVAERPPQLAEPAPALESEATAAAPAPPPPAAEPAPDAGARLEAREAATPGSEQVAAVAPAPAPPPVPNRPPVITARTPEQQTATVQEGGRMRFGVTARDPDADDRMAYVWRLDGRTVSDAASFEFVAPSRIDDARAVHRLDVEVRDRAGERGARDGWDVEVTARRPRLVRLEPMGPKLAVELGASLELRATADVDAARWEWTLDGSVQDGAAGTLRLPEHVSSGRHTVLVAALDSRGLRSAPYAWTIDVHPPPPAAAAVAPPPTPAPSPAAPAPPAPSAPAPSQPPQVASLPAAAPPRLPAPAPAEAAVDDGGAVTPAEARTWLSGYRAAYEARDAAALERLGIASAQQAERIVAALKYEVHVSVENAAVSVDGGETSISFDRTDTTVKDGTALSHPRRTCRLAREGGRVVARGCR